MSLPRWLLYSVYCHCHNNDWLGFPWCSKISLACGLTSRCGRLINDVMVDMEIQSWSSEAELVTDMMTSAASNWRLNNFLDCGLMLPCRGSTSLILTIFWQFHVSSHLFPHVGSFFRTSGNKDQMRPAGEKRGDVLAALSSSVTCRLSARIPAHCVSVTRCCNTEDCEWERCVSLRKSMRHSCIRLNNGSFLLLSVKRLDVRTFYSPDEGHSHRKRTVLRFDSYWFIFHSRYY